MKQSRWTIAWVSFWLPLWAMAGELTFSNPNMTMSGYDPVGGYSWSIYPGVQTCTDSCPVEFVGDTGILGFNTFNSGAAVAFAFPVESEVRSANISFRLSEFEANAMAELYCINFENVPCQFARTQNGGSLSVSSTAPIRTIGARIVSGILYSISWGEVPHFVPDLKVTSISISQGGISDPDPDHDGVIDLSAGVPAKAKVLVSVQNAENLDLEIVPITFADQAQSVDLTSGFATAEIEFMPSGSGEQELWAIAPVLQGERNQSNNRLSVSATINSSVSTLLIEQPSYNQEFSMTSSNNYSAPEIIPFLTKLVPPAVGSPVTLIITLEYQTSGKRGTHSSKLHLNGIDEQRMFHQFTSIGGKMIINATASVAGKTVSASPVTAFITGTHIPDEEITDRLIELYTSGGGATRNLMTCIAMKESSYAQFFPATLYELSSLWPHESYDGGSHIGLMMMPTTSLRAWDWKANTKDGVEWFTKEKTSIAKSRINNIIKAHPGLRQLTATEMERQIMLTYGPGASSNPEKQFYIPQSNGHGGWEWIENFESNNPVGIKYVKKALTLCKY